jgi:hypothetical protein
MKKLALIALIALALPATAAAKGPSKALIVGQGTTIRISGAEGSAKPFWRFVEAAGFFEAAWGPSRLSQTPLQGDLGPRYTITWAVPSSSELRQDIYPYAKPYPVTYMPQKQRIYDSLVKGGWFAGGARLEKALLRIGVPSQPPPSPAGARPAAPTPPAGEHFRVGALAGVTALFVAALAVGATALRRRSSSAAGT